jgi:hypothetical protein
VTERGDTTIGHDQGSSESELGGDVTKLRERAQAEDDAIAKLEIETRHDHACYQAAATVRRSARVSRTFSAIRRETSARS